MHILLLVGKELQFRRDAKVIGREVRIRAPVAFLQEYLCRKNKIPHEASTAKAISNCGTI